MIYFGIVLGLTAALFQSLSYLFARRFSSGRANPHARLLASSHIVMGVVALAALPWVWPEGVRWDWTWGRPVILCTLYYLVGQGAMFLALQKAEASKVSPLLAIKVVMLAFLTWSLAGAPLTTPQWLGVAFCLVGAFLLTFDGGGLGGKAMIALLGACLFYSLSDMNITDLVRAFEAQRIPRWDAVLLSVCVSYVLGGVLCLALIPFVKDIRISDVKSSAGFAFFWLVAMVFLYATFSIVGTVYGNILQSTRGIISIVLGAVIAGMGHHHIEARTTRAVFLRRLTAGVVMTAAIVAFGWDQLGSPTPRQAANKAISQTDRSMQ